MPPGRRILVVDDNVDSATMLGMLLKMEGHEIELAGTEVRTSQRAALEVERQGGDLHGAQVDVDAVQVALQDQVRDLGLGLAPLLAVHLDQQVEGAYQEVAATAGRVQ